MPMRLFSKSYNLAFLFYCTIIKACMVFPGAHCMYVAPNKIACGFKKKKKELPLDNSGNFQNQAAL